MRVASFETSKKLKELGFKARFDCYYDTEGYSWNLTCRTDYDEKEHIPAYDLETVINALRKLGRVTLTGSLTCGINFRDKINEFQQDEPLANTAARLLIKLIERGLVEVKNV